MNKKLIILYTILLYTFNVYGYPYDGWGGDNNYSSTTYITPTLSTIIVGGFLLFGLYVAIRVWWGLKKDKDKPNEEDE